MYEKHHACTPPPADAVLWRYMDFTKYVSLLATRALFFARVDKLDDPFEGSLSELNVLLRRRMYGDMPTNDRDAVVKLVGQALKDTRQFNLVNCWHQNSVESEFMWKLYAKNNAGVAIMSKFDSLKKCFTGEQPVFIGQVYYVDYHTTVIPEVNTLLTYLHKRKSFEHEREVRALTRISGEVPAEGEFREVDLSILVHEVLVAPYATDWLVELVESVTRQYGLSVPVCRSGLAATPVW